MKHRWMSLPEAMEGPEMLKKKLYRIFVAVAVVFCFLLLSSTISISEEKQQPKPQAGERGIGVKKEAPPADFGNYHAVLIGINKYEDWPVLKTPINDISAIKKTLVTDYGFQEANIVLVDDNTPVKPTHSNILKVIRDKSRKLTDKDNLLIYYAGHGQIDDLTGDGYWISIEAKVNDVSTWLPHSSIRSILESAKIKVKNLLLVADSCYSGIMLRGVGDASKVGDVSDENYADKLRERSGKKSREIITSGGNEPVMDMVSGGENSLFAHYFLKALNGNKRRYIDMETLFQTDIRPRVAQTGKQIPANFRLRAITDEDGLFILTKYTVQEVATLKKEIDTGGKSEQEKLEMKNKIESLLAKLADSEAQKQNAEKKAGELELKSISDEKEKLQNMMASVSPQVHKKMLSTKDRFKDNGDGTVTDIETGLMWVRNANIAHRSMNWEDAMKYCEEMNLLGFQDWRLPAKSDFLGLIDKEGIDVALPPGHPFSEVVKFGDYWTSSINPLGPMYSYVVNVGNGSTRFSSKNKMGFVWAVRFSGVQQQSKK